MKKSLLTTTFNTAFKTAFKTTFRTTSTRMLATAIIMTSTGCSTSHWSYTGATGPENWAKLSPDNQACTGRNQSPINLSGFIEAELKPLKIDYHAGGYEIINNGHTVQVNYKKGSRIKIEGQSFELKQYHFHSPSENHIKGRSYPLEAHFVHANKKGDLAVVAVMFAEGKTNKALGRTWLNIPQNSGDKVGFKLNTNAQALLPKSKNYYRFNGSLTTPPCSEGVRWFVMKGVSNASKEQISMFTEVMHHANNRPIQNTNARPILQ